MENIVWTTKIWAWSGLTYTRVWMLPGPQCTGLKGKKYTHAHLDLFLNLLDLSMHVEICESTPRASVPIQHPVVHFMAPPSHVHAFPLWRWGTRLPRRHCPCVTNLQPLRLTAHFMWIYLMAFQQRKKGKQIGGGAGGREGRREAGDCLFFLWVLSVFCFMWFDTSILDA